MILEQIFNKDVSKLSKKQQWLTTIKYIDILRILNQREREREN